MSQNRQKQKMITKAHLEHWFAKMAVNIAINGKNIIFKGLKKTYSYNVAVQVKLSKTSLIKHKWT